MILLHFGFLIIINFVWFGGFFGGEGCFPFLFEFREGGFAALSQQLDRADGPQSNYS